MSHVVHARAVRCGDFLPNKAIFKRQHFQLAINSFPNLKFLLNLIDQNVCFLKRNSIVSIFFPKISVDSLEQFIIFNVSFANAFLLLNVWTWKKYFQRKLHTVKKNSRDIENYGKNRFFYLNKLLKESIKINPENMTSF